MNRRDILKGVPALPAGLVAGTCFSAIQPTQQPNLSWGPQPHYYVLYVFHGHPVDDFVAVGVYTRKVDADAHEAAVKASFEGDAPPRYARNYCGAIVERSHEEFCYELADCRLGAVAEHMKRFINGKIDYGPECKMPPTYAELYGRGEFPAAVAERGKA
jgi:hypothetical protein